MSAPSPYPALRALWGLSLDHWQDPPAFRRLTEPIVAAMFPDLPAQTRWAAWVEFADVSHRRWSLDEGWSDPSQTDDAWPMEQLRDLELTALDEELDAIAAFFGTCNKGALQHTVGS